MLFCFLSLFFHCTLSSSTSVVDDTASQDISDQDQDGVPTEEDCNDEDASISPLSEDSSIDGIDQNCDGIDGPDADQDGLVDHLVGGEDCDDYDPESTTTIEDPDCDGFPTWLDCDDNDPNSTIISEDSNCDGFIDQPCTALSFDGVDDIMESSHALQVDDFTIEMWIHPPASVIDRQIIMESNLGTTENMISLQISKECKLRAEIRGPNQNVRQMIDAAYFCEPGWRHIALVREDSDVKLFTHGYHVKTISFHDNTINLAAPLMFGFTQTPHDLDTHFQGRIHSVQISSVARYNQSFITERQVADEHTTLLWYLSEGEGEIAHSEIGEHEGIINGPFWVEDCPFVYRQ